MWIKRLRITLLVFASISFILLREPQTSLAGTENVTPKSEASVQLIEPVKATNSLPKLGAKTADLFGWLGLFLCLFIYWKLWIVRTDQKVLK